MKAYELIKETYLRKGYIRLVHISWFLIYGLLFLIPFPPDEWNWGLLLFGWSGGLLPLILSAGIFGDDIATGRISVLVTKPIRSIEFYIYRLGGLSLQGALHIIISGGTIFILQSTTGRGSANNLGLWMLSAWLLFNTATALSTSLSILVKREHNSIILFLATIFTYAITVSLMSLARDHALSVLVLKIIKYAFPPVELLVTLARGKYGLTLGIGCVIYAVGQTVLYSTIGIILLNRREFRHERD